MVANVETMAYAGQVPWHGLGNQIAEAPDVDTMLVQSGLDWKVIKAAMYTGTIAGTHNLVVPSHYALVRSSDESILGVCGKDYVPTQNKQALEFFRRFTEAGHMKLETAGSLDKGRQVWALAKIGDGFKLAGGDAVDGYLLLSSPHVWGKSLIIKFTPIRVVCQNTLMMALRSGGTGNEFRMPHRMEFDPTMMRTAEEALGIAQKQLLEFKVNAQMLADYECAAQTYYRFLTKLFAPKDFELITPDQTLSIADLPRNAYEVSCYLNSQPGGQLKSAKNTWWGALNSVTYWVDHKSGRERDSALTAAWFGTKARLKEQAYQLAIEAANDPKVLLAA